MLLVGFKEARIPKSASKEASLFSVRWPAGYFTWQVAGEIETEANSPQLS